MAIRIAIAKVKEWARACKCAVLAARTPKQLLGRDDARNSTKKNIAERRSN